MERMREIREAKGLTQADLSAMTGFNQGFLSKIEKGQANPSLDKITAIASALGVAPFELFTPSDLKARVLLAIGAMDPTAAEAAVVVLEKMAGAGRPPQ
jgi:transcriptional regulator with XRE-family HTH domain